MSTSTADLAAAGVSIWLDDLSRSRIITGNLAELIQTRNVTGVTTNPTIFAGALTNGEAYEKQVGELAMRGASVDDAIFEITTDDVRNASDIFRPIFDSAHGTDGRVSIEVSPDLAHDTAATVAEAKKLWKSVDRPNALIKIPATKAGLPAITEVIGAGISVNVTLIFSLERYAAVINAYLTGLETAQAAGIDISTIESVASFFVSRVDTEVNKRLTAVGTDKAEGLKSLAGVANARLAYELYIQAFAGNRATQLAASGANVQRPLWASTGVKDPGLPDTLYVTELVAPGTVNTMPEQTLEATFDHGEISRGYRCRQLRGCPPRLRAAEERRRRLRRCHPRTRKRGRREVHCLMARVAADGRQRTQRRAGSGPAMSISDPHAQKRARTDGGQR